MSFNEHGYQIFPSVFAHVDIQACRAAVDDLLERISKDRSAFSNIVYLSQIKESQNQGISITPDNDAPFIVEDLSALSPVLKDFIMHDRLRDIAARLLHSQDIVYHFSNLTRKPPYIGPRINWHRDYPNENICTMDSGKFLRFLIPLDPMLAGNGCTQAIPGSHLITDEAARELKATKEKDYDPARAMNLEAQPGDVIAIHSKLAHGGTANRSSASRNLIVIQYGVATDELFAWYPETFTGMSLYHVQQQDIPAK